VIPEFLFDREEERQSLRQRLGRKQSFLLYGPSGVGKSLLLKRALPDVPQALYSPESASAQAVFHNLATVLLTQRDPRLVRSVGRLGVEGLKVKSAVSLKGVVMDALHEGQYYVVLDHLKLPSYSFAAAVREIMGWGKTPVVTVARSAHMEDIGFLKPFYADRSERLELRNFPPLLAEQFAEEAALRVGLSARNMSEFLERVLEFSDGNPGAILSMLEMAKDPKYHSAGHIKITPLYIDFRMNWKPAGVR